MQDFKGKAAVITGAASGIGRGLARQCAAEGMKIALADIDEEGLDGLSRELIEKGASVEVFVTDVRDFNSVEKLARSSQAAFGSLHLVFNNAGVMLGGYAWERSEDDWRWVFDVNFFGVVNGLRAFMPVLLEQG
ncbi:MAG: SDR family NAD(P)-dependent oxidoreductase, partial [Myxococcota bacterium]|nr:SDR family NAD(P)-dependent oxidoreductase [Myxococcota bacterium]